MSVGEPQPAGAALRTTDEWAMAAALEMGRRNVGQTFPNPAVGALILDARGHVAGRGWTARGGRPHAEPLAIAAAGERARGGTIYVTLEPCSHFGRTPPCANAIVQAGLARVVAAIGDPNPLVAGRGFAILRTAGIAVAVGVGAQEARRAHAGHISRVLRGRPHVQLKIAASADGKSALAGRQPVRITGEAARAATYLLRAEADAVMIGIGTVLADDPLLTVRLPGMEDRSPMRVVLDSQLRTPLKSQLVRTAGEAPTLLVASEDASAGREAALLSAGVEVLHVPEGRNGRVDLLSALRGLGEQGITRVLVEGGPILSGALLRENLADEFLLFEAPQALGEDALPAIEGGALDGVLRDPAWSVVEDRVIGPDRFRRLWRD